MKAQQINPSWLIIKHDCHDCLSRQISRPKPDHWSNPKIYHWPNPQIYHCSNLNPTIKLITCPTSKPITALTPITGPTQNQSLVRPLPIHWSDQNTNHWSGPKPITRTTSPHLLVQPHHKSLVRPLCICLEEQTADFTVS